MMVEAWNKVQDKFGNPEATFDYADTPDHNVHQFDAKYRQPSPTKRIGGGEHVFEVLLETVQYLLMNKVMLIVLVSTYNPF